MQAKVQAFRIVVVGAGGTGCALLPLLAAMRPDALTIIDGDTVAPENLERQPLFGPEDIGRSKVKVAAAHLARIAPLTHIEAVPFFLDPANAHALFAHRSVVADCTDDLHARMLVDRVCAELRIPLVTGAVHGTQIQVMTLHFGVGPQRRGYSLGDWFPGGVGPGQDGCAMRDVPAAITTLTAACMALRIQQVRDADRSANDRLDHNDPARATWLRINAPGPQDEGDLIARTTIPQDLG
jgi:molybdopterin/thiamine biosynthesis adenylyltransferase